MTKPLSIVDWLIAGAWWLLAVAFWPLTIAWVVVGIITFFTVLYQNMDFPDTPENLWDWLLMMLMAPVIFIIGLVSRDWDILKGFWGAVVHLNGDYYVAKEQVQDDGE